MYRERKIAVARIGYNETRFSNPCRKRNFHLCYENRNSALQRSPDTRRECRTLCLQRRLAFDPVIMPSLRVSDGLGPMIFCSTFVTGLKSLASTGHCSVVSRRLCGEFARKKE